MFLKLVNLISERERISQKNNQSRFSVKKIKIKKNRETKISRRVVSITLLKERTKSISHKIENITT